MMKYPVILVLSEGRLKPNEIINNLRRIPENEEKEIISSVSGNDILGYTFHLTTKYYKTSLYLVPFEEDITLLPTSIEDSVECVLIYFDSGKRSFSTRIPIYAKFLKENNIELGMLLCDRLHDDSNEGITYKEAKQESRFLDVVELERKRDENEEDDPHDPLGYDEVLQALRSFLWSNVDIGASGGGSGDSDAHNSTGNASKSDKSLPLDEDSKNPDSIEAELEAFEKLLVQVMDFKNSAPTLTRNQRLAYIEEFAHKFEHLVEEDDFSSAEDEN